MAWFLWVLLILVVLVITVCITWIVMSYRTFPHSLSAGEQYTINGRTYNVPELPVATYKGNDEPSLQKKVPMLDKGLLRDLRALVGDTFAVLNQAGVEHWVTGGTLISATLWGHLMCYDDDCDLAVDWKHREYLWSKDFARDLSEKNLEAFFLRGMSLQYATREGAAVRIRRKGQKTPTVDVFFNKDTEDGKYTKVNTWSNDKLSFNAPEAWERTWVFPVQKREVDGMIWSIPNQPEKMLDQQYGEDWKKVIKVPKPLFQSHQWAFWISNLFGAWRTAEHT